MHIFRIHKIIVIALLLFVFLTNSVFASAIVDRSVILDWTLNPQNTQFILGKSDTATISYQFTGDDINLPSANLVSGNVDILFAIDYSGSMSLCPDGTTPTATKPSRMEIARNAIKSFLDKFNGNANVRIGLMTYSNVAKQSGDIPWRSRPSWSNWPTGDFIIEWENTRRNCSGAFDWYKGSSGSGYSWNMRGSYCPVDPEFFSLDNKHTVYARAANWLKDTFFALIDGGTSNPPPSGSGSGSGSSSVNMDAPATPPMKVNNSFINLTAMNSTGYNSLLSKVNSLTSPFGATNTGDALRRAYYTMQSQTAAGNSSFLILITDGDPNVYTTTNGTSFITADGDVQYLENLAKLKFVVNSASEQGYVGLTPTEGLSYATTIGNNLIKNAAFIKNTFIIGFTNDVQAAKLQSMATACGSDTLSNGKMYYTAADSAALQNSLTDISKAIGTASLSNINLTQTFPAGVKLQSFTVNGATSNLSSTATGFGGSINVTLDKISDTVYKLKPFTMDASVSFTSTGTKTIVPPTIEFLDPLGSGALHCGVLPQPLVAEVVDPSIIDFELSPPAQNLDMWNLTDINYTVTNIQEALPTDIRWRVKDMDTNSIIPSSSTTHLTLTPGIVSGEPVATLVFDSDQIKADNKSSFQVEAYIDKNNDGVDDIAKISPINIRPIPYLTLDKKSISAAFNNASHNLKINVLRDAAPEYVKWQLHIFKKTAATSGFDLLWSSDVPKKTSLIDTTSSNSGESDSILNLQSFLDSASTVNGGLPYCTFTTHSTNLNSSPKYKIVAYIDMDNDAVFETEDYCIVNVIGPDVN